MTQDLGYIQFIGSIDDNHHEEIMSCDSINNHIVHQEENGIMWKLKHLISYEGLNIASESNDNGYWYNIMVEWGHRRLPKSL